MYFVCDLKKYPEELQKNKEYLEKCEHLNQELEFTIKKLKNLKKEKDSTQKQYFDSLYKFADKNNLMPEGSNKDWYMEFNQESNQVFTKPRDKEDHPLAKILGELFS